MERDETLCLVALSSADATARAQIDRALSVELYQLMGKIVGIMDWKVINGTAMTDRFLREIGDTHHLRKEIRSLSSAKAEEFMKRLGDAAAELGGIVAARAQLGRLDRHQA